MSIKFKITAGFALVLVLTAFVGAIGWTGLSNYVAGVHDKEQLSAVVSDLQATTSKVWQFRDSGDAAVVTEAVGLLDHIQSTAKTRIAEGGDQRIATTMSDISAAADGYSQALSHFAELDLKNDDLRRSMALSTREVETLAVELRDVQQEQHRYLKSQYDKAAEERAQRLQLSQQADELIRFTLTARQAEALYRLTRDAQLADDAKDAIKGMFLANLGLRKLTKGTEEEAAVGEISKEVNAYRKAFAALIEALETQDDVAEMTAEQELTDVSTRINDYTSALEKRQKEAYEAALVTINEVSELVTQSTAATSEALNLVAAARTLRIAEQTYMSTRGADGSEFQVRSALADLEVLPNSLKALIADEIEQLKIDQIGEAITNYNALFEQVVVAVADQATAQADMATAEEQVVTLVTDSEAILIADMASKKDLSSNLILIGALGALAIGAVMAVLISRSITGPISRLIPVMQMLAAGKLDVEVPDQERRDEIGAIAQVVQVFKLSANEMEELREQQAEAEAEAQDQRNALIIELADNLEVNVKTVIDAIADSSNSMADDSKSMASLAEQTLDQAGAVSGASEEASGNVQSVASAAEELSRSIDEVRSQVERSSTMAQGAAEHARVTNSKIEGLVEEADKIGEIIELISNIAEQTNLLALNATIEAARAGDAGKGFAVVANEVKSLATQTAKATEQISQQISSIQGSTSEAAGVIRTIGESIVEINEIASSISSSVQQQSQATQEIARSAQDAQSGSVAVSSNISGVTGAAEKTRTSASNVLDASTGLADRAQQLAGDVQGMMAKLRESAQGDRRREKRHKGAWTVQWSAAGQSGEATLENLSPGGAFMLGATELPEGTPVSLVLAGLDTTLEGQVSECREAGLHIAFDEAPAQRATLEAFLGDPTHGTQADGTRAEGTEADGAQAAA